MGLGKITRAAGKIGLAIEVLTYVVRGGKALVSAIRGKRSPVDPGPESPRIVIDHGDLASDERAADDPDFGKK